MKNYTKKALCDSFLKLCADIPLSKITVNKIVEECGVSKPTFYKYFKDKYELMNYIYQKEANYVFTEFSLKECDIKKAMIVLSKHCMANKNYYTSITKYDGQNSFRDFFYESNLNYYYVHLSNIHGEEVLTPSVIRAIKFNCSGANQLFLDRIIGGMKESPEQIATEISGYMPEMLKELLYRNLTVSPKS